MLEGITDASPGDLDLGPPLGFHEKEGSPGGLSQGVGPAQAPSWVLAPILSSPLSPEAGVLLLWPRRQPGQQKGVIR